MFGGRGNAAQGAAQPASDNVVPMDSAEQPVQQQPAQQQSVQQPVEQPVEQRRDDRARPLDEQAARSLLGLFHPLRFGHELGQVVVCDGQREANVVVAPTLGADSDRPRRQRLRRPWR